MLHSLQETKCDALLLLLLLQPTQAKFNQQQPQQHQKRAQFQYENSTKARFKKCISVFHNKFLYAYMPHTYATVN